MKLAVFGDIHGNDTALAAVLEDMDRQGVDRRVCLGDIAFRGPQPVEALERVYHAGLDGLVVGNTDQWLFQGFPEGFSPPPEKRRRLETFLSWARQFVDTGWQGRLRELPLSHTLRLEEHTVTVVHSSPRSTEDWYAAGSSDQEFVPIFEGAGPCDILIYGHIHTPFVRRLNRRWLLNTGSVGNPIDGDHRASYALLTSEGGRLTLEIRRVTYDVDRVAAAAKERDFPFAKEYAEALRAGAAV